MGGIDAQTPLGLEVMQHVEGVVDFGVGEDMVRVTLSTVQAPGASYGVEVLHPGQDQVQLVSVLGSEVAPGGLVLKECVGDGQLVEIAQLEKPLTVLVHLANTMVSNGGLAMRRGQCPPVHWSS